MSENDATFDVMQMVRDQVCSWATSGMPAPQWGVDPAPAPPGAGSAEGSQSAEQVVDRARETAARMGASNLAGPMAGGATTGASLKVTDPYADVKELRAYMRITGTAGGDKPTTRLAFNIPAENTVLALGAENADKKTDKGIFARTDNHLHFEVGAPSSISSFTMGTPSRYSSHEGGEGWSPSASKGISLATENYMWLASQHQLTMLSMAGDVVARSMCDTALLQADTGDVTVYAGKDGEILSPGRIIVAAHAGLKKEVAEYAASVEGVTASVAFDTARKQALDVFDYMQDCLGILTGYISVAKKVPHRTSNDREFFTTSASLGIEVAKKLIPHVAEEGTVSLSLLADHAVQTAARDVDTFGKLSARFASEVAADVVGGLTAGLKSLGYTGVWGGAGVGVEGLNEVTLTSVGGWVAIDAHRDVTVAGENACVSATKFLGLHAKESWINGTKAAGVRAGDSGFALCCAPGNAWLGSAKFNTKTGKCSTRENYFFHVSEHGAVVRAKGSQLELTKKMMRVHTDEVEFVGKKTAKFEANKILLG